MEVMITTYGLGIVLQLGDLNYRREVFHTEVM
jgi:hypothetical protein